MTGNRQQVQGHNKNLGHTNMAYKLKEARLIEEILEHVFGGESNQNMT